jgi:PAS domain S-box-containing protein
MRNEKITQALTVDLLLNSLSASYVLLDMNNRIQFFNDAATNLDFFLPDSLALDRDFSEVISEERRPYMERAIKMLLQGRKPVVMEVEFTNQKDEFCCVEITYSLIQVEEYPELIAWEGKDVSRQKIFERKLAKIANDTSNLLEQANAIIFAIDARGYITDWNRRCEETTGFMKNEVYTKQVVDVLIRDEFYERFEGILAKVLIDQKPVTNLELPIQTKAREELTLLLSVTPRVSSNSQVIGATLVGQDISEGIAYRNSLEKIVNERTSELQKALEKEKELLKVKDRFVSVASHEFRTPLSSIQFSSGYLRKFGHKLGKEQMDQKLDAIDKQLHHMINLLDDVLTVGKVNSGQIKPEKAVVYVHQFFESICEEIGQLSGNTHNIYYTNDSPGLGITSDEKLLRNVFINLITNAIKFSPDEEGVFVDVSAKQGLLTVSVRDTGIGIEQGEMEKIFEAFHRAGNANSISGTGLGLSIAKKAVELLGGEIEAESTPGLGSCFTVKFRLNTDE